ncbi:MAG: MoaA/NifB/PqqE/SkfB family radical SAM enzyme [Bacteriovoracaceae bacterium]
MDVKIKLKIEVIIKENNEMCILPWVSLTIRNKKEVTPCMHYNFNDESVGKTTNIKDIFRSSCSDMFTDIKQKMLSGVKVEGCQVCTLNKKDSFKKYFNSINKKELSNINDINSELSLKYLSLGLGNTCNLACLTCGEQGSNTWALYHLGEEIKTHPRDFGAFLQDIDVERLKHLEELTISGGEPLLCEYLVPFLTRLKRVNANIKIIIFTNASIPLKLDFSTALEGFSCVLFHISIDHLEDKNDALRFPLKWNVISNNLSSFSKFEINIFCTLSILNITYLQEFIDWYEDLSFPKKSILFNPIHAPKELSPFYIKESFKEHLKEKYLKDERLNKYGNLYPVLMRVVDSAVVDDPDLEHMKKKRIVRFKKYREVTGYNLNSIFKEVIPFTL